MINIEADANVRDVDGRKLHLGTLKIKFVAVEKVIREKESATHLDRTRNKNSTDTYLAQTRDRTCIIP